MLICTSMMPSAQLTVLTDPLKVDYSPSCHYLIYTLLYFCLEAVIHTLLMHMCMTNVTNIHLITRSPQLAHFHFLSSIHSHQYPLSLSLLLGVTAYLKPSVAGFLLQKELDYLQGAVDVPKRPFAAIVGGSKVDC